MADIPRVRIVVVGDAGSGKSSLCAAFAKDGFQEQVDKVLPPYHCTLSTVAAHPVQLLLIDTSSEADHSAETLNAMRQANAIIITYDLTKQNGLQQVETKWLPLISNDPQINASCIYVAATKQDLIEHTISTEDLGWPDFCDKFDIVEGILACSSKLMWNLEEVVHIATKGVLYPRGPLLDFTINTLKPAATLALRRIFFLCDKDFDGNLSEEELNYFQIKLGNDVLSSEELIDLMKTIAEKCPEGVDMERKTMNEPGFLTMMHLFLQKGQLKFIWDALSHFGYDINLNLDEKLRKPDLLIVKDWKPELSKEAKTFLKDLFQRADTNKDGYLTERDLERLTAVCPQQFVWRSFGWPDCVPTLYTDAGETMINLKSWILLWKLLTALDYEQAYSMIMHLGFWPPNTVDPPAQLLFTLCKKGDQTHPRKTFVAYLFGDKGVGKSSILRMLTAHDFDEQLKGPAGNKTSRCAIQKINKTSLVLVEIGAEDENQVLAEKKLLENKCDVACLLYQHGHKNTFHHFDAIFEELFDKSVTVPIIPVITKSDLVGPDLSDRKTASKLMRRAADIYHTNPPAVTSAKSNVSDNLFPTIIDVALHGVKRPWSVAAYVGTALVVLGSAVIGSVAWNLYKNRSGDKPGGGWLVETLSSKIFGSGEKRRE